MSATTRQKQIEALVPTIWVEAVLKGLRAVGLKERAVHFSPDGVIVVETEQGQTFRFEGDPWVRLDKPTPAGREARAYAPAHSTAPTCSVAKFAPAGRLGATKSINSKPPHDAPPQQGE